MTIEEILYKNHNQVLTSELILGIVNSLAASGVSHCGYVFAPCDYLPENKNDNLVFDKKDMIAEWVADQVEQTGEWGSFYAMGIIRNNEIIGGIVFNNFNNSNATVHIAILKTSKLFVDLMKHAADYAFNHCKLKRLTGLVESSNKKALALDYHLGFEEEFVMKKAGCGGQDLHVLVMWPEGCRWLS